MPPVNEKVKEQAKKLETFADELHSELKMKSNQIEKLMNENKSIMNRCFQLKAKCNLIEDEPILQNNKQEVHMYVIYIYVNIVYFESELCACASTLRLLITTHVKWTFVNYLCYNFPSLYNYCVTFH